MRGVCDTCNTVSELFQLAGRSDMNCSECNRSIESAVDLYGALQKLEAAGYDASELGAQLKCILETLLDRARLASHNLSPPPLPTARYSN